MDNHEKLILAALGELPRAKTLQEVARDYSRRIRDAVMPVSVVTAPIVVSLLTQYAEEIKKNRPGYCRGGREIHAAAERDGSGDYAEKTGGADMSQTHEAWTAEDDARLLDMKRQRMSVVDIADCLGRTVNAVNFRMCVLRRRGAAPQTKEIDPVILDESEVIEEYSAEEMRAATKQEHTEVKKMGNEKKEPCVLERPIKDAKTALEIVRELVSYATSDEDKLTEGLLSLGQLHAIMRRLVDDLEAIM